MFDELPTNHQEVEVHFEARAWLAAFYRNGEFVDAYGLPLDRTRISGWRPLGAHDASAERKAH